MHSLVTLNLYVVCKVRDAISKVSGHSLENVRGTQLQGVAHPLRPINPNFDQSFSFG